MGVAVACPLKAAMATNTNTAFQIDFCMAFPFVPPAADIEPYHVSSRPSHRNHTTLLELFAVCSPFARAFPEAATARNRKKFRQLVSSVPKKIPNALNYLKLTLGFTVKISDTAIGDSE